MLRDVCVYRLRVLNIAQHTCSRLPSAKSKALQWILQQIRERGSFHFHGDPFILQWICSLALFLPSRDCDWQLATPISNWAELRYVGPKDNISSLAAYKIPLNIQPNQPLLSLHAPTTPTTKLIRTRQLTIFSKLINPFSKYVRFPSCAKVISFKNNGINGMIGGSNFDM